jgi:hypothetical protein
MGTFRSPHVPCTDSRVSKLAEATTCIACYMHGGFCWTTGSKPHKLHLEDAIYPLRAYIIKRGLRLPTYREPNVTNRASFRTEPVVTG